MPILRLDSFSVFLDKLVSEFPDLMMRITVSDESQDPRMTTSVKKIGHVIHIVLPERFTTDQCTYVVMDMMCQMFNMMTPRKGDPTVVDIQFIYQESLKACDFLEYGFSPDRAVGNGVFLQH